MTDNQKTTKADTEIPEHISELGRQVLKNCQGDGLELLED